MLSVWTNSDLTTQNHIVLGYFKNIDLNSKIGPMYSHKNASCYTIKVAGKYLVKGLIDDPINTFFAYLFTIDNNLNSGTFRVFKIDFKPTALKYTYTDLSMSSG